MYDRDFERRFWLKVEKGLQPNACWSWLGRPSPSGYCQLHVNGRQKHAHRVAYEIVNGDIPKGLVICHSVVSGDKRRAWLNNTEYLFKPYAMFWPVNIIERMVWVMSSNVPRQNAKFNLDEYITVSERVERFYEKYPEGRIITNVIELNHETGFVLMQAMVYRDSTDAQPAATGHASETRGDSYINKNSFVENCETGSVGRALALLGFEVKRGIASREELEKTSRMTTDKAARAPNAASSAPVTTQTPAAPVATANAEGSAEQSAKLDAEILQSAGALGYDAAKVRKWIDQKFKVTGGLDALGAEDKREVLRVFREKAAPGAKGTTK